LYKQIKLISALQPMRILFLTLRESSITGPNAVLSRRWPATVGLVPG
jgi:hypothetical protein